MSLSEYKKKRKFNETPEPSGGDADASSFLRFVVQKHHASRLHYDFRLEMDGVLKSWAIPKGPSLNPKDKRLAMMVEDHPYDYRNFEGIIPERNYGAGTVIVWDEGTYMPAEPVNGDKAQQEKALLRQLHAGNLKIKLNGKKLSGEFALVRTKGRGGENAWLLIKKQDEAATVEDVTQQENSVVSGLGIEEVAKTGANVWQNNRPAADDDTAAALKSEAGTIDSGSKKASEKNSNQPGEPATAPVNITPMMASLTSEPFDDPNWLFEIKWDGYRAIATIRDGKAELESRNNISFTERFYPVTEALQQWKVNAVLDGEIITVNKNGVPDFQQLQSWQTTGKGNLVYYVFDILWLEGRLLMTLPLLERKQILKDLMQEEGVIKYSDHVIGKGKDFFQVALKEGLEGIMAKDASSFYIPGVRTQQWLKIKTHKTQEAVIAGFTKGKGARKHFGALILGIYNRNEFVYIGHTGSGFDDKNLASLSKKLKPLVTDKSPFKIKPKTNMAATWVTPEVVCEVKYQQWTNDNQLRFPIFLRLREDKKAEDVRKEESIDVTAASAKTEPPVKKIKPVTGKPAPSSKKKKMVTKKKKMVTDKLMLPDPDVKETTLTINKQPVKLTSLDKLYWPKEKVTKRDVLNYYDSVCPFMLPYIINRPQSLNRYPQGIEGTGFYQKDVKGKVADWLSTYEDVHDATGEKIDYLVCTGEASLLYMANLGCIEINPWHSTISAPDNPNWCVIDLDPDDISFDKVIETANVVKKVLDALGMPSCCKTSGSTGLHIYIPMGGRYDYAQSRQLAELIVNIVQAEIPAFTSIERNPAKRRGRIYLDYLQNRPLQTIAAPYSLRPKPGATVSTPLHWEEVTHGLSNASFTIFNTADRLKNEGDLFAPVVEKGIDLARVLEKAGRLF